MWKLLILYAFILHNIVLYLMSHVAKNVAMVMSRGTGLREAGPFSINRVQLSIIITLGRITRPLYTSLGRGARVRLRRPSRRR